MILRVIGGCAVLGIGSLVAFSGTIDSHAPTGAFPRTPGNRAGVPFPTRYSDNRAVLAAAARLPGHRSGQLARLARGGRQILDVDPRGDGRVVEVFGDLANAASIAVVVPGNSNTIGNFDADPVATPGAGVRADALDLYRRMRGRAAGGHVATIAWLGYDPPENIDLVSAESARAQAGARVLDGFVRTLPRPARVTLVCHSYGTVVCGRARRADAAADNLVALGSPGLDVGTAADLPVRTWAARASGDPIAFTPHVRVAGIGHGTDPITAAFGGLVFGTGRAHGHTHYFDPGGASLRNIARICLGDYSAVTGVRDHRPVTPQAAR